MNVVRYSGSRTTSDIQDNQIWVFGYGSLIWNPDFKYVEQRIARIFGYHRALCIYSHHYRGTPDKPGLVFGLDKGGSCNGIAFRIRKDQKAEIFAKLHEREMPTKVYTPTWLSVCIGSARVRAYGFVADRQHQQYVTGLSEDEIIFLIRQGKGSAGTCIEYVRNTLDQLTAFGIKEKRLGYFLKKSLFI